MPTICGSPDWHPTSDAKKVTLRLCMNGRFLYTHERPGAFIAEVGLHEVPRDEWRDRLSAILADRDPTALGTIKWPWGDTILNTSPDQGGQELLLLSEHEKHTLDREFFWFTVSGHLVEQWTPEALMNGAGDVLAEIRPGAQALGYRFAEVTLEKGYRGPYQRLVISRLPA